MKTPTHDPIAIALEEDIGSGDVTTELFVDAGRAATGLILAKEPLILAGVETAAEVFRRVDPALAVTPLKRDGDRLTPGTCALEIRGSARSILTAERVALNFVQRLSGIATATRRFVEAVAGTPAKILDTRKTTPGLRALEKAAVAAGGGTNHRFGLYDQILVKDNHLAAGASTADLQAAIRESRKRYPNLLVEVEADTLDQVRSFLGLEGIDVILLDNMTNSQLREAVALGRGKVKFEASGGVSIETIRPIASTGVDFVSVGAITHSAKACDFSLELHDA